MATFNPPTHDQNGNARANVPVCPNHGEPLEGLPNPLPAKGTGICPVSKVPFDYEIDLQHADTETRKDANGNVTIIPGDFKVTGDENADAAQPAPF